MAKAKTQAEKDAAKVKAAEAKKVKVAEKKAKDDANAEAVRSKLKMETDKKNAKLKIAKGPEMVPGEKMVKVKGLLNSTLKDGCHLKVGEESTITEREAKRLEEDPRGLKYFERV